MLPCDRELMAIHFWRVRKDAASPGRSERARQTHTEFLNISQASERPAEGRRGQGRRRPVGGGGGNGATRPRAGRPAASRLTCSSGPRRPSKLPRRRGGWSGARPPLSPPPPPAGPRQTPLATVPRHTQRLLTVSVRLDPGVKAPRRTGPVWPTCSASSSCRPRLTAFLLVSGVHNAPLLGWPTPTRRRPLQGPVVLPRLQELLTTVPRWSPLTLPASGSSA